MKINTEKIRRKLSDIKYHYYTKHRVARQALFRYMLPKEDGGFPYKIPELPEFPAGNQIKEYFNKGVYENPKGAIDMAKWRSCPKGVAIIVVVTNEDKSNRFIVYSAD